MAAEALLYTGAIIPVIWGVAYGFSVRSVVAGFPDISLPNKRLLVMAWISGAMTLIFLGSLNIFVTLFGEPASGTAYVVYLVSAVMLVALSAITFLTTGRSPRIMIRIFPYVTAFSALLLIAGAVQ